jgi:hypothetical protein
MSDMTEGATSGPSDREVVALLQRLASAQAQLLQAEQASQVAGQARTDAGVRNDQIEEAHTELLWAQAQLITAQKEQRARKTVEQAKQHEKQVLSRFGFGSFRDYLNDRTSTPTTDIHLEVARAEYEAAQNEWDLLTQDVAAADSGEPTIVLDLTGDDPRRIA